MLPVDASRQVQLQPEFDVILTAGDEVAITNDLAVLDLDRTSTRITRLKHRPVERRI